MRASGAQLRRRSEYRGPGLPTSNDRYMSVVSGPQTETRLPNFFGSRISVMKTG
jgi:hypothetical protein